MRFYDERDGLPKYPLYMMTGVQLSLVAKDEYGSLWLVDLPSMRRELLLKKDAVPPLLDASEVEATYRDGEGNLWFGTRRGGLFRARKKSITAYSESSGIIDRNVYPIYQDRARTIWIGSGEDFPNMKTELSLESNPSPFTPSAKTPSDVFSSVTGASCTFAKTIDSFRSSGKRFTTKEPLMRFTQIMKTHCGSAATRD
jgi:hypothetical protein